MCGKRGVGLYKIAFFSLSRDHWCHDVVGREPSVGTDSDVEERVRFAESFRRVTDSRTYNIYADEMF